MSSSRSSRPLSLVAGAADPQVLHRPGDVLARVAEVLVAAHDPRGGPTLVRVAFDGDDVRLGLLPVPPDLDARDLLLCSRQPDEWEALGLVFSGVVAEPPPSSEGSAPRLSRSTIGAVLIRRDGSSVSVLDDGDEVRRLEAGGSEPPVEGRLADALRRSLGLGTPEPASGVAGVVARVWLHRVHAVAVDGRRVDADVVAALRPPVPRSWSDLRQQCADGAWPELACDADVAEWMDDGMFSRWCLAAFPDAVEVLGDLAELAAPAAAAPLADALAAWR